MNVRALHQALSAALLRSEGKTDLLEKPFESVVGDRVQRLKELVGSWNKLVESGVSKAQYAAIWHAGTRTSLGDTRILSEEVNHVLKGSTLDSDFVKNWNLLFVRGLAEDFSPIAPAGEKSSLTEPLSPTTTEFIETVRNRIAILRSGLKRVSSDARYAPARTAVDATLESFSIGRDLRQDFDYAAEILEKGLEDAVQLLLLVPDDSTEARSAWEDIDRLVEAARNLRSMTPSQILA